jgi:hypothetical protein
MVDFVTHNGTKSWAKLAQLLPGRIGKQCRERWFNSLDLAVNRRPWTPEEDRCLFDLHAQYGNHWTRICELMPGRSDSALKNRWHSNLSKRQDIGAVHIARPMLPSIALFAGSSPDLKDLPSLRLPVLQAVQPREAEYQEDAASEK